MKILDDATRNRIIELLGAGATNRAIARELGLDKSTPARYRRLLGIAPATPPPPPNRCLLTVEEKWRTLVRPTTGDHMEWSGRLAAGVTPVMPYRGKTLAARPIAYRVHTGRDPVGYVKPGCGQAWCVAPEHQEDERDRIRERSELGAILGRRTYITECTRGHAVAEHRRYLPNGRGYCGACHELAKQTRESS
ncbi:HNH endonuclease [Streptomyces phage Ignacio]|uniref:HNH endonuclease n=2 Tax=Ignaciovirus TaxID=3152509 RepID=A0A6M9Z4A0_9CAUD|nr:HNH endonuclease [Streptomyces phage Ignacio]YP_010756450.1 HNH endonuclease [Streptomyces phage Cumberbatch]QKN87566.1 HNH endonuclease [Streptomyces phage Ignacio]QKN87682.1 HNH endonuclease [Streptomyces phage Cumberbatch]